MKTVYPYHYIYYTPFHRFAWGMHSGKRPCKANHIVKEGICYRDSLQPQHSLLSCKYRHKTHYIKHNSSIITHQHGMMEEHTKAVCVQREWSTSWHEERVVKGHIGQTPTLVRRGNCRSSTSHHLEIRTAAEGE